MRDLAFLDFETTGRDPMVHEIVEAGVLRVDGRTMRVLNEVSVRVQPQHLELAEPDALKMNGFSEPWGGLDLRPALERITPLLEDATLAGQNVARFDLRFLEEGCRRTGVELPRSKYVFDIASLCWPLLVRGQVESLSLASLCAYFGISNAGAHGALVDCRRALEVARRVLLAPAEPAVDRRPFDLALDSLRCAHQAETMREARRGIDGAMGMISAALRRVGEKKGGAA